MMHCARTELGEMVMMMSIVSYDSSVCEHVEYEIQRIVYQNVLLTYNSIALWYGLNRPLWIVFARTALW